MIVYRTSWSFSDEMDCAWQDEYFSSERDAQRKRREIERDESFDEYTLITIERYEIDPGKAAFIRFQNGACRKVDRIYDNYQSMETNYAP